ncbi:HAD hydrolase-like protein [Latilactobacillus fuchuensis]|uniref:HAD hydrolase-like protein n=1 Tax=Latilactobacillus fuchuensis TaxID=164393 RepID=UPI0039B07EDD
MTKGTILFDLDGTIADSQTGILNSLEYMIEELALPTQTTAALLKFIGPPLNETIMTTFGLDEVATQHAIKTFQAYYEPTGLYQNELYPGMIQTLADLQAQDYQLAIATSKPEPFAKKIIAHLELTPYFSGVYGASVDETTRVKKADVITYALNTMGLSAQSESLVMVGDRQNDILGAKANQIPAVGVSYGYGSTAELKKAGALAIVAQPTDLVTVLPKALQF